ncbi:unnamed protein product [Prorocentrum cordatum]|uniref:Uncharacterized protein n=1 Tax=Prorocentrum cordatum TaxID=2364126 RepID=A0ABN9XCI7_9DINO|nr:unnamed protein product [Polarella glacialis]
MARLVIGLTLMALLALVVLLVGQPFAKPGLGLAATINLEEIAGAHDAHAEVQDPHASEGADDDANNTSEVEEGHADDGHEDSDHKGGDHGDGAHDICHEVSDLGDDTTTEQDSAHRRQSGGGHDEEVDPTSCVACTDAEAKSETQYMLIRSLLWKLFLSCCSVWRRCSFCKGRRANT